MERLTYSGTKEAKPNVTIKQITDMLAAYEDTGLTPPEVTALKERDTAKKPMQTEEGMVCPMCGNKAYPWNKFCDACGQRWWEE